MKKFLCSYLGFALGMIVFFQSTSSQAIIWDQTRLGAGLLVIPQRNQLGFIIEGQLGVTFTHPKLCSTFLCHAAETRFRTAFGAESYESYVPYALVDLTIVRFQAKEWLSWGGGVFHYLRNPKKMDTEGEIAVALGHMRIAFHRKNSIADGGCGVRGQALGATYWTAFSSSQPFAGLYLLGLTPFCEVKIGKPKASLDLFAELSSHLSVGKSGDGTPEQPGSFGSLFSESWLIWAFCKIKL